MSETGSASELYTVNDFHILRDFFLHFIPLVCLGAFFIIIGMAFQKKIRVERIKVREYNIIEQERMVIQTDLTAHASDTMLFSEMLRSASSLSSDPVFFTSISEILLLSLSRVKHVYDQVRYLDIKGNEVVRINLEDGIPRLLEKQELQTKRERSYFTKAIEGRLGDVFISPFDLNIEHGKVERPLKPMLRFSTAVDNSKGERIGVVVLNYLGKHLIDTIKCIEGSAEGDIYLVNQDGYWLVGPSPENEWGFMFPQKSGGHIREQYPELWSYAQEEKDGQLVLGDNLFTFSTMTATPHALHQASAYPRLIESEHWLIVSRVSLDGMGAEYSVVGISLVFALVVGFGFVSWFWSSTRQKKYQAEMSLYRMATTDGLTELQNRRHFVHCVETEIERALRYGRSLSLVLFDIDHFKRINDTYGHDQGDEVLMALARCARKACREHDVVARVGGEEFAVLLPETEIEHARMMAERLREAVEQLKIQSPAGEITCTISLGVTSMAPDDSEKNFQTLFKSADLAMYQAKEGGRNRVVVG